MADFRRDGFCVIGGVLDSEEVTALCEATDHYMDDEAAIAGGYVQSDHLLRHANELDPIFLDLLAREPIYSLMEALFGEGFQQCGANVLRSGRGVAIEHWHADDGLFFPLPDDVPRHDPRIQMPVYWLTVQMALSDIEQIEHGPTQYVPGSHYSGRNAPDERNAGVRRAGTGFHLLQGRRHLPARPAVLAPRRAQRLRPGALPAAVAVRSELGLSPLQRLHPPPNAGGVDGRRRRAPGEQRLIGPQRRHPEQRRYVSKTYHK